MFDAITHQSVTDEVLSALRAVSVDPEFKISHAPRAAVSPGDLAPPRQTPFEPTPSIFPKTVTVTLSQAGQQYGDITVEVPPRMLGQMDEDGRKSMAAALSTGSRTGQSLSSRLLHRGQEITYYLPYPDSHVHLEVRWGQLRACTITDASTNSVKAAALFDPHEPVISHPGPELVSSAAFMERLPVDVWREIADLLPTRDRSNFSQVGKAQDRFFSELTTEVAIVREGTKKVLSELSVRGAPQMDVTEVMRFQQAWDSPLVSQSDRQAALDLLRPTLELMAEIMSHDMLTQRLHYAPTAVRDLLNQILQPTPPGTVGFHGRGSA